jgi:hypothetical protein|uniref:MSP domain-containing protein n=1 Tax=Panagrolaimus sp. PS1159 TaxID=55785 RepID=A0AC35GNA9_9BILA
MSKSDSDGSQGSTESSNSTSNDSGNDPPTNKRSDKMNSPPDTPDKNLNTARSPPPPKQQSPKRLVQATELRFQCIEGRPSVARVAVLLCNISDRPLYYKFKTDTMDLLSALPSATGHIAARGSSRVVLTWQRPKAAKTWHNVSPPKLLLVTRFLDSGGIARDTTSTRLIAYMDSAFSCQSDNPPIEQLMLDALSKSAGNDHEITVTKSSDNDSTSQALEATLENQNPNVTLAIIFLAIFIGVCLYRALHPVTYVVRN